MTEDEEDKIKPNVSYPHTWVKPTEEDKKKMDDAIARCKTHIFPQTIPQLNHKQVTPIPMNVCVCDLPNSECKCKDSSFDLNQTVFTAICHNFDPKLEKITESIWNQKIEGWSLDDEINCYGHVIRTNISCPCGVLISNCKRKCNLFERLKGKSPPSIKPLHREAKRRRIVKPIKIKQPDFEVADKCVITEVKSNDYPFEPIDKCILV